MELSIAESSTESVSRVCILEHLHNAKVKVRNCLLRRFGQLDARKIRLHLTQLEAVEETTAKREKFHLLDICYGDIVTIRKSHSVSVWAHGNDGDDELAADDGQHDGQFLCTEFGGVVDEDLVVTATDPRFVDPTKPEPQNLQTCLFRVVPKLSYLSREQLAHAKDGALERKIHHNANKETLREYFGRDVMYGDLIQLQHLTTDKFITLKYCVSPPSCVHPSTEHCLP